jgi:hypothetical protein
MRRNVEWCNVDAVSTVGAALLGCGAIKGRDSGGNLRNGVLG